MLLLSTLTMAGTRLAGLSFTCSVVGLLGLCLYQGVESASKNPVIHKKVGDNVEFSSSLSSKDVTFATWKYKQVTVAEKDKSITEANQFKGRTQLDPENLSLTIKELTLADSGEYQFISEADDQQQPTVIFNLQVHEPIDKKPHLKVIKVVRNPSNESCTVNLECITSSDPSASYFWTVGNRTRSGPRLEHVLTPQDGETNFTCTVSNFISDASASIMEHCSNSTLHVSVNFKWVLGVAAGGCLGIVIIVGVAVCVHCFKRKQPDSDAADHTVYADISDVRDETMKPSSLYETIETVNFRGPVDSGTKTVYDQIQFDRVKAEVVSQYQEVS